MVAVEVVNEETDFFFDGVFPALGAGTPCGLGSGNPANPILRLRSVMVRPTSLIPVPLFLRYLLNLLFCQLTNRYPL